MGNAISESECVELSNAPADFFFALIAEDMTVVRTDKSIQSGWRVPQTPHGCRWPWARSLWTAAHAYIDKKNPYQVWRLHMVRDDPTDEQEPHVCGWRACGPGERTFWPTRLTTEEEKEAWWAELDLQLNTLGNAKDQADQAAAAEERHFQGDQDDIYRIPPPNLGDLLGVLKKHDPHHANRANRLLNCGVHKDIVRNICSKMDYSCPYYQHEAYAQERHTLFTEEEAKLGLEPLAYPTNL